MKTLLIFLDDALKYDKEYTDKLNEIHEKHNFDGINTSIDVCNWIVQEIKELNAERNKKIKENVNK